MARTLSPHLDVFSDSDDARWMWGALRAAFPAALGCVLMPDHLHLVAPVHNADAAAMDLQHVCRRFAQHRGAGAVWSPHAPAVVIRGADKLQRQLRYVALNPCRPWQSGRGAVQLVDDPVRWLWSTHRDVLGAVTDPWVHPTQIRVAIRRRRRRFLDWFHGYVTADPSVDVQGTPRPVAAAPRPFPWHRLQDLAAAAAAAHRASPHMIQARGPVRDTFIHLAVEQGWHHTRTLAACCGIHPRSVRRIRRKPAALDLQAARLCLGDSRLMWPTCAPIDD